MNHNFTKRQNDAEICVKTYLDARYDTTTTPKELQKLERQAIQSLVYLVDSATKKYRTRSNYEDCRQAAWEEMWHRLETFEQAKCGSFTFWAALGINREAGRERFYQTREEKTVKSSENDEYLAFYEKDSELSPLEIAILRQNLGRLDEEEMKILQSYLNNTGSITQTAIDLGYGRHGVVTSYTRKMVMEKFNEIIEKVKIY